MQPQGTKFKFARDIGKVVIGVIYEAYIFFGLGVSRCLTRHEHIKLH